MAASSMMTPRCPAARASPAARLSARRSAMRGTPLPSAMPKPQAAPRAVFSAVPRAALLDISDVDLSKCDVLDEEAMCAASEFPIKGDAIITRTKAFLATQSGLTKPEFFADDFEFVAPVVGPLKKEPFREALASFDLFTAIPDLKAQNHHFRVDPLDPSRVWFTTKPSGTHTGMLAGAIKPTGKVIDGTYQTCSVKFNEEGKVVQFTIGYPMDRRTGNTGGLGGVFGIFYAVGSPLPFPEAQPWKQSKRYKFFNFIGQLTAKLKKDNK